MDHPVAGVCRRDVFLKVPFLSGESLPVTHLQVGPLGQLLQLELEVTVQTRTLHLCPRLVSCFDFDSLFCLAILDNRRGFFWVFYNYNIS